MSVLITLDLVRHLPTVANHAKEITGSREIYKSYKDREIPLLPGTELLMEQFGDALGARYREEEKFLSIHRSDTVRTAKTTEALVARLRPETYEIKIDKRLREKSFGLYDGLDDAARKALDPALFDRYEQDKVNVAPPEGESWAMVQKRGLACIEAFFKTAELTGQTHFVAVTHSVTKTEMMATLMGLPLDQVTNMDRPLNGSVDRFVGRRLTSGIYAGTLSPIFAGFKITSIPANRNLKDVLNPGPYEPPYKTLKA